MSGNREDYYDMIEAQLAEEDRSLDSQDFHYANYGVTPPQTRTERREKERTNSATRGNNVRRSCKEYREQVGSFDYDNMFNKFLFVFFLEFVSKHPHYCIRLWTHQGLIAAVEASFPIDVYSFPTNLKPAKIRYQHFVFNKFLHGRMFCQQCQTDIDKLRICALDEMENCIFFLMLCVFTCCCMFSLVVSIVS
jgi:hypothetical protein